MNRRVDDFPDALPEDGDGERAALERFERLVETRSARLGDPAAFAHMDPPVPAFVARLVGLNARHNQNLLHPALSPFATEAERVAIDWLAPYFGQRAGHLCAGSTIANLTALWCAREHGARRVAGSVDAHLSVPKAAHVLGLDWTPLPVDDAGRLRVDGEAALADALGGRLDDVALVLTAGTTGRGAIDPLGRHGARWVHVDAAWAGPLRLTRHRARLDGIERADSVAVSAHKWLYQPKDSALALFRDPAMQDAIAFGGAYLATPNVGLQGSRGAAAIPLLATLAAWGRRGLAERIERSVDDATELARRLERDARTTLLERPATGVVVWRPARADPERTLARLGPTSSSLRLDGALWLRQVAANRHADVDAVWAVIDRALDEGTPASGASGR